MYEMGLLHQPAKPTIILADPATTLPFDVRSLMVLTYDGKSRDEARLADQVAAATGQLLRFFDHAERTAIAGVCNHRRRKSRARSACAASAWRGSPFRASRTPRQRPLAP